jgi:hypothetical protein
MDWRGLKIRRMNKTRKLMGDLIYHATLDNSYIGSAGIYKKQGGEYRLMPYTISFIVTRLIVTKDASAYTIPKMGFCDFLNADKYFVKDIVDASNYPYPFPCPFPNVC